MSESLALPADVYEMNIESATAHPHEKRVTVTFLTHGGKAFKYEGEIAQQYQEPATGDKIITLRVREASFLSEERVR